MKIFDTFRINAKKLKYRTSKALFLIIPIVLLVALSIIISSQVKNFQIAMDESIFGEIEEESTVIELEYQMDMSQGGFNPFSEDNQYTEADIETIKLVNNVVDASMNYSLPISNIVSNDLFDDISLSFREINTLNTTMASIYTSEGFDYTEGKSIPIILNANTFIETYEDWEGEDTLEVDFKSRREMDPAERENPEDMRSNSPTKTRAIDYDKADLIGKEFTISFGGFSDIQTFDTERSEGSVLYTKLTDDEIQEKEDARTEAVSEYWDYEKLKEGITYTFKIVGVLESSNSQSTYIPEEFAQKLMSEYISLQLDAQNDTEIDTDLLNSTYLGSTYDLTELVSSNSNFGFGRGRNAGPGGPRPMDMDESSETNESYDIPGLIIELAEDGSEEVIGIYKDTNVFEDCVKTGNMINIKINSIYNRNQVVDDLNSLGYAYQDTNDLEVFASIQETLDKISVGVVVAFILLTIAVIILTMSKFVSESTNEIGIFRAVGFTKKNILTIFLTQSLLYTAIGYLFGLLLGVIGNLLSSSFVSKWFDNLIASTIKETFNVVSSVDQSIFQNFDIDSIAILSSILVIITLIISFIPAIKASNVSPVEAIKNE